MQVGLLRDSCWQEVNEPRDMAEVFSQQFILVFTVEDTANVPVPQPVFRGGETDQLVDNVSVDAVKSRLEKLREDKSPDDDDLPAAAQRWSSTIGCPAWQPRPSCCIAVQMCPYDVLLVERFALAILK